MHLPTLQGLGKTLQGVSLLWTLLNSGHEALGGTPVVRRAIICCPTSLVSNWDAECSKWLKARSTNNGPVPLRQPGVAGQSSLTTRCRRLPQGRLRTLPLCESSREDVISSINQFLSPSNYYNVRFTRLCRRWRGSAPEGQRCASSD
jgi:DNA repair and recombination RAD54-like protein